MRIARIAGADPKPLGAPSNWDQKANGHCGELFVRREVLSGVTFMRSAWDVDQTEAQKLFAGGQMILGVAGTSHPVVHLEVGAPPLDAEPVYSSRRATTVSGESVARVEALYPAVPGARCWCEAPICTGSFATATAIAIEQCDILAAEKGWLMTNDSKDLT